MRSDHLAIAFRDRSLDYQGNYRMKGFKNDLFSGENTDYANTYAYESHT